MSLNKRLFLSPPHLGREEIDLVRQAFESNYIAPLGPMVDSFEKEFAHYVGIPHCLALASGTAAMHLALRELGVGSRDEVLASTLTFIGSVTPATFLGASVAFIDADESSWNMDPRASGRRTRRVCPPRQAAQGDHLAVCGRYEIPVVADAAEAMGARYFQPTEEIGRKAGGAMSRPMHLQPVFQGCRMRGGAVSEPLFRNGLCLPSGTAMADSDLERVAGIIRRRRRRLHP